LSGGRWQEPSDTIFPGTGLGHGYWYIDIAAERSLSEGRKDGKSEVGRLGKISRLTFTALVSSFIIMIDDVREAAKRKILFLPHALRQMLRPSRLLISAEEIHHVIHNGSIIEDYRDDPRGPSCLMLGFGIEGRPIHVVCAPREDYLAIITTYIPEAGEWSSDFKRRKKS
jgi:hypothetical protein